MTDETIVAVYDTSEHATLAVRDLEAAGIPSSAISQHSKTTTGATSTTPAAPAHEQGFWASLFGSGPDYEHDTTLYDRSLQGGSTVVTVKPSEHHLTQVMDILERHNPVDLDERAASYSVGQTTPARDSSAPLANPTAGGRSTDGETIPLAEERVAVGKRAINRGTTRVRRYVVETPVQEQVSLRDETVSVERRPVAEGRPITNPDFTDKVVEVTENAEEAVISKTARVKEEVVIHKEAAERTETVRDTVRREDVEITKEPGVERQASTTSTPPAAPERKI